MAIQGQGRRIRYIDVTIGCTSGCGAKRASCAQLRAWRGRRGTGTLGGASSLLQLNMQDEWGRTLRSSSNGLAGGDPSQRGDWQR